MSAKIKDLKAMLKAQILFSQMPEGAIAPLDFYTDMLNIPDAMYLPFLRSLKTKYADNKHAILTLLSFFPYLFEDIQTNLDAQILQTELCEVVSKEEIISLLHVSYGSVAMMQQKTKDLWDKTDLVDSYWIQQIEKQKRVTVIVGITAVLGGFLLGFAFSN